MEVDGSHSIKFGRIFNVPIEDPMADTQEQIGGSKYVAHLGSSEEFLL